ncbi:phage baseplate assembly protein V [Nodosilinea nodulosa]|uniref:phage baseplate assembly protein V n=1 Tax=Nodosilinea nodulosa TaxID=416001 RepID=UPI0002D62D9C|nr:phage baseplate assembly protein V [Nodosilinea nodulosa]
MMTSDHEQLLVELSEFQRSRYFGKYRGLVRDVDDPEGVGRLVAQVPEVYGEEDSPWAWPAVPFAGPSHGLVLLPEVGDGVWIEFEAGDISRPIWTGCWWARGELPDPGGTETRALVTSGGHKLVLDDQNNQVQILHAGGAELTMTNSDITLKIGATQVVLSASGVNVNNGAFQVR